ncbi:MAG: helix-turn-helix domain-containing protein [Mucilaginibacter sp.]
MTEESITNWENNNTIPQIQHFPRIIQFLGYYPFDHETESVGGKVRALRHCLGLSYEAAGEVFAVHASTVITWERNRFRPSPDKEALILARWDCLPGFIRNKTTQYESTEKNRVTIADVLQ